MGRIPDKDREKITENYLDGISVEEIAKKLGWSKSAIYNIIHDEGYSKEDVNNNNLNSEEEEEKARPTSKTLDENSDVYDIMRSLKIPRIKSLRTKTAAEVAAEILGITPEDLVNTVFYDILKCVYQNHSLPDENVIANIVQGARNKNKILNDLRIDQEIDELKKIKREEQEAILTPEQKALILEQEEEQRLEAIEQERLEKAIMVTKSFPTMEKRLKMLKMMSLMDGDKEFALQIDKMDKITKIFGSQR